MSNLASIGAKAWIHDMYPSGYKDHQTSTQIPQIRQISLFDHLAVLTMNWRGLSLDPKDNLVLRAVLTRCLDARRNG